MKFLNIKIRSFASDPTSGAEIVRVYNDRFAETEIQTAWQASEDEMRQDNWYDKCNLDWHIHRAINKLFELKGYDMKDRWSMIVNYDKIAPKFTQLAGLS